jgi:hypothetical protein
MNNIQPAHTGKGIAGVERYGLVHGLETETRMPSFVQSNTSLAPPSGNPYLGKYQTCLIIRNDGGQCKGPRAKGTDYCIGHLRSMEKAQKEQEKPSE